MNVNSKKPRVFPQALVYPSPNPQSLKGRYAGYSFLYIFIIYVYLFIYLFLYTLYFFFVKNWLFWPNYKYKIKSIDVSEVRGYLP